MRRIAVTGAAGRSGRVITQHLAARGFDPVRIDRFCPPNPFDDPIVTVDLTRYGDVVAALHGCDAIVHFGANPWPDTSFPEGADRFANNTVATFNVFQAAAQLGIPRVVWASSETVQGFPYEDCAPARIPIIESDAPLPRNGYALSKLASEGLAEHMSALHGTTILGLRLANILYEDPSCDASYARLPEYWAAPELRKNTIWKYIDAFDVADLVETCLTAQVSGAEVFNACAADTLMPTPTRDLFARYFPGVPIAPDLPEFGSPVSIEKAARLLGWVPSRTWQDYVAWPES